jgi:transketolase C-terminal domain/subunit
MSNKKITLINLYVGMGSFGRKISPEVSDLTDFTYDIAKYEPFDVVNLFNILEHTAFNKYIRIPHLHFPESIFSVDDVAIVDAQTLGPVEILSLTGYGYAGEDATIITTGANFSTILQLGDLLQEEGIHTDMFVLSKLTIDMPQELKSSLHKTKKLIRIMDQLPNQLESLIAKWLENF